MNAMLNNAVIITKATGSFLIGSSGRTLFVGSTPGEAFRSAIIRKLKLVNNTSQKGIEILRKVNAA